jgi:NitT/TauT family transport system substrate-binding protein
MNLPNKIICLTILVVVVLSCQQASAQQGKTYKIGTSPWIAWTPVYVAETKGFWTEQGINVRVITFGDSTEINEANKSGLIDLGFDMIGTAATLYLEGYEPVVVAETNWSHGGDKIVVKKGLDINSVKGSPIGTYFNGSPLNYFLNLYLKNQGLSISDFRIIELPANTITDLFIEDRFKIIVNYEPEATRAVDSGNGLVGASSGAYAGCIPEGLIAKKKRLSEIPREDLVKILKGWIKAVEWTADESNRAEYIRILNSQKSREGRPYSLEGFLAAMEMARVHGPQMLGNRNKPDGELAHYLIDLKDFLKTNGMLTRDFNAEDICDTSAIMSALEN